MSGSFYFAARFSRRFELQGYRADLLRAGHEVTSRWIDDDDDTECDCAVRDVKDVEIADGLILFTEVPRETKTRHGRLVEFGIALALGKRLLAIGGHDENVFFNLKEVEKYPTWATALVALKGK
jgi:nucleoside 2-deoxyribosyltransferase